MEGGAGVVTSMLGAGLADRLVVGLSPTLIGTGLGSVGELGVLRVRDGLRLHDSEVHLAGEDVLIAGDLAYAQAKAATASS